jgi:hypothetical protein
LIEDAADGYEQKKILIGHLTVAGTSGYTVAVQNVSLTANVNYTITTSLHPYLAQFYLTNGAAANLSVIRITPNGGNWDIILRSSETLTGQLNYVVSDTSAVHTRTVDITPGINSHNLLTTIEPNIIQIYDSTGILMSGLTIRKTQSGNWYAGFHSSNPTTILNAVITWI